MVLPNSHSCQVCGRAFTATRCDASQCSQACRQRAYRQRQAVTAEQRRRAADLLQRQTRAIIDGADPVVLAAIAREAETLLAA